MKFYISSFYNIRFFQPNQIPISTAVGDPAWFHNNSYDKTQCFVDKNSIMNGIREELLSPAFIPTETCVCQKNCPYKQNIPNCPFLISYRQYLQTISIKFDYLLSEFNRVAEDVRKITNFEGEPEIILLVHESEDNKCSERVPLQEYFKANGYELKNWTLSNSGIIF